MKFTRNTVNGINDTILASNDYTAIPFTVTELWDENGEAIAATPHAMMKFKMRLPVKCSALSILRRIK